MVIYSEKKGFRNIFFCVYRSPWITHGRYAIRHYELFDVNIQQRKRTLYHGPLAKNEALCKGKRTPNRWKVTRIQVSLESPETAKTHIT